MKVTPRPAQIFYINRNVQLLQNFFEIREKKVTVRKALVMVSKNYSNANPSDAISASLIRNLVYNPNYPYGPEAWEIFKQNNVKNPIKTSS